MIAAVNDNAGMPTENHRQLVAHGHRTREFEVLFFPGARPLVLFDHRGHTHALLSTGHLIYLDAAEPNNPYFVRPVQEVDGDVQHLIMRRI